MWCECWVFSVIWMKSVKCCSIWSDAPQRLPRTTALMTVIIIIVFFCLKILNKVWTVPSGSVPRVWSGWRNRTGPARVFSCFSCHTHSHMLLNVISFFLILNGVWNRWTFGVLLGKLMTLRFNSASSARVLGRLQMCSGSQLILRFLCLNCNLIIQL